MEEDDRGSIEQDISDFYQLIFKYSFDKFLKRFEKRWVAFKRLFGDKNSFVYNDSVLTPEDAKSPGILKMVTCWHRWNKNAPQRPGFQP